MVTLRLNKPRDIDVCSVDFDPSEFRRTLFQEGLNLTWDWAVSCPCQSQQVGVKGNNVLTPEHRIACPGCAGSGLLYVNRHDTMGMLIDSTQDGRWANIFARYAEGSVFITLLPEHLPAVGDRLSLKDGFAVYEDTRLHESTTQRLRYPVIRRPIWVGLEGSYGAEQIEVGVLYCRAADASGVLQAQVYEEGTHFFVDDDGLVVWTDGPALGVRITWRYHGRPHYVVRGFPHTRRDFFRNDVADVDSRFLMQNPIRVVCEPEFLGGRLPPVVDDVTGDVALVVNPDEP